MGNTSVRAALYDHLLCDLRAYIDDRFLAESPDGDPVGMLPVDATPRDIAICNLSRSLVKKFQDEIDDEAAQSRAKHKFLDANDRCRSWNPPSGLSSGSLDGDYELELWGTWCWNFRKFWNSIEFNSYYDTLREEYFYLSWDEILTPEKIAFFADVGPGAVIDGVGHSFLEKFTSPVSYSGQLSKDLWKIKCANPNYRDLEFYLRLSDIGFTEVDCNSMLFVPKTVREHRSICVEPSLLMFFQQGVRFLLEHQLKAHFGIDLAHQQDRNRALALAGSLAGSYGTIDLTSASDMIAYKLVEASVPSSQFRLLDGLRSTKTRLPDDTIVDLQMFSTMGNSFTFPLMTAIFAAVVETAYQMLDIPFKKGPRANWAVNGDDIVVVAEAYDEVVRLLRLLGFIPNLDKSFNKGFFRESCGGDYYKGRNVRGVYIKSLKRPQDAISALNRLMAWSVEWDVSLPFTCQYLRRFAGKKLFRVPFHESEVAGLRVPFDSLPPTLERKWISLTALKRQWAGTPYAFWRPEPNLLHLAQYETTAWWCFELTGHGFDVGCLHDGYVFPPCALMLSLVKGEIRDGAVTRRANAQHVRYRVAKGWTHSWDSIPWVGGPLPNGLVPLKKDYVSRYLLALSRNGLA